MDCRHRQITEIGSKLITGSLFFSLLTTAFTLISCGGGAAPPSPPTPDFGISISPSSVSSQVGTTTPPLTISVNAQNGFNSPVNIRLQGIPQGVTTSPSSPFSVGAGASQSLTF